MQGKQPQTNEHDVDDAAEGVYGHDFGPGYSPDVEGGVLNHDVGPEATGINHDTGRGRRTRGGHTTPSPTLFRGKFS